MFSQYDSSCGAERQVSFSYFLIFTAPHTTKGFSVPGAVQCISTPWHSQLHVSPWGHIPLLTLTKHMQHLKGEKVLYLSHLTNWRALTWQDSYSSHSPSLTWAVVTFFHGTSIPHWAKSLSGVLADKPPYYKDFFLIFWFLPLSCDSMTFKYFLDP